MPPTRLSEDGQQWLWLGSHISTMDGEYPRMVIAAILANRDATTDEQRDAAEVLIWTVEEHPPWGGWCPTCRTQEPCEAQRRADVVALEYLIKKSTELMALNRCKYPHLQPIRTQLKGA